MAYTIEYRPSARREFADLPRHLKRIVRREVDALAVDPRPAAAMPMWAEWNGFFRLRIGEYRVIYTVVDREERIVVVRVRHRSDIHYEVPISPYGEA